jgi:hypothetical protein
MDIKDGTYEAGYFRDGSFGLKTEIGKGQGYWVSDDTGVTIKGEPDSRAIADALSLMDIEPGEIVGVWTNGDTTYIDRSYHFIKKDTAWKVAELFDQIAIWDCKNKKSLDIRYA